MDELRLFLVKFPAISKRHIYCNTMYIMLYIPLYIITGKLFLGEQYINCFIYNSKKKMFSACVCIHVSM